MYKVFAAERLFCIKTIQRRMGDDDRKTLRLWIKLKCIFGVGRWFLWNFVAKKSKWKSVLKENAN